MKQKIIILIILALAAVGWMTVIDHVWPKPANGQICETTTCEHPVITRQIHRKYKRGDMWRSGKGSIEFIVSAKARRQFKRAYVAYTKSHSYSTASPGLAKAFETQAQAAGRALPTDWPSPGDWWRTLKTRANCITSGITSKDNQLVCAVKTARSDSVFRGMAEKTKLAALDLTRVVVKCGGSAILGGITEEGKDAVKKRFNIRPKGGIGMVAFGAACLWPEYFNKWWPW